MGGGLHRKRTIWGVDYMGKGLHVEVITWGRNEIEERMA